MTNPRFEYAVVSPNSLEFKGRDAREMHEQVAGRPPVFNTRTRRWVTSPRRLADLVALAESKGYVVVDVTPAPSCDHCCQSLTLAQRDDLGRRGYSCGPHRCARTDVPTYAPEEVLPW